MSHSVFQTGQIMQPLAPIKPLLPTKTVYRSLVCPPVAGKLRKCCNLTIRASAGEVDGDSAIASLESCFQVSPDAPPSASSGGDYGAVMKGGQYGAFGAITLEKSKLDLNQKQTKSSLEMWILGNPVRIEGCEYANERAIYISNHASLIDIFLIMWLTPTGTVGIAKKEIIFYPLFGQLYVLANHLRIDRSNPAAAIESMKEDEEVAARATL